MPERRHRSNDHVGVFAGLCSAGQLGGLRGQSRCRQVLGRYGAGEGRGGRHDKGLEVPCAAQRHLPRRLDDGAGGRRSGCEVEQCDLPAQREAIPMRCEPAAVGPGWAMSRHLSERSEQSEQADGMAGVLPTRRRDRHRRQVRGARTTARAAARSTAGTTARSAAGATAGTTARRSAGSGRGLSARDAPAAWIAVLRALHQTGPDRAVSVVVPQWCERLGERNGMLPGLPAACGPEDMDRRHGDLLERLEPGARRRPKQVSCTAWCDVPARFCQGGAEEGGHR